jgi:hypothetical protein
MSGLTGGSFSLESGINKGRKALGISVINVMELVHYRR